MKTRETSTRDDEDGRRNPRARHPTRRRRGLALVLAALAWLSPMALRAQVSVQDKAAAEALYVEGQKLLYDGATEAACQRFEQSQALDPGVGTLLYLAECYDRLGRTASAWVTYRDAESAARAIGDAARARVARERAAKGEPQLSRVSVQLTEAPPPDGLELRLNGTRLNSALFGVPFPMDPGRYELVAGAPGRKAWSKKFEVKATETQTLQVPPLERASEVAPLPAASDPYAANAADPAMTPGTALTDTGSTEWTPRKRAAVVVATSGVAALATGVALGIIAQSKDDEATRLCGSGCVDPSRAESLNAGARDWALGANIAYVVGGLALATGGALFFWPDAPARASARRLPLDVSAQLGPNGGLLTVGGAL